MFLEFQLRLAGGNETAGRVEIFLDGFWGTVCHHGWSIADARVVCHQLGFPGALSAPTSAAFGEGAGPIHLDDVYCEGVETDLVNCSLNRRVNCGHSQDAGVICVPLSSVTGVCIYSYLFCFGNK